VVGITDESEAIVYMSDYAYVQSKLGQYFNAAWGYVTDVAHAPDGTAPLERGEIYVSTIFATHGNLPAIGDTVSVCGQVFTVKGVLDVLPDFDATAFEAYVCDRYGVNVFENKETFCEWWYGANFYNYSEWLEYYGEYATDYEADIAEVERAYTHEYNDVLSDYFASFGEDFPCVVLNEVDLLTLTASLETRSTAKYTLLEPNMYGRETYYAFYGEDVDALSQALIEKFGDGAVYTPQELHEYFVLFYATEVVSVVIVVAVIIAVMCLCLYFIMRSSLMNRIKEVGIYRAIGVSKRNLVFRFFVEAIVLATLTVFIGYLFTSTFIFVCLGMSSLVSVIFFV
jgi:ABC-type antimicrobial peptide transport system permease subunit